MSSRRSFYVGPYIEARSPMGPETVAMTSCTNPECKVNRDHMPRERGFCNRCGAPVGMIKYQQQAETVDADDLRDLIKEAMTDWPTDTEGLRIWTPNVRDREEPRDFDLDPQSENGALALDAEGLPQTERAWLRRAFGPEIEALATAYGANNVHVRWGVVWMWT